MKQRVLVVEDQRFGRELVSDRLAAEGYEVAQVENIQDGRRILESDPPGAVVLDLQVTGENGLLLVSWMRRQRVLRHIPVIAITVRELWPSRERALQAGCSGHVFKPVDFELLRKHLRSWLARQTPNADEQAYSRERKAS